MQGARGSHLCGKGIVSVLHCLESSKKNLVKKLNKTTKKLTTHHDYYCFNTYIFGILTNITVFEIIKL